MNNRRKNPQQNISKQNSTRQQKNHAQCSSGIFPRDTRMVQYEQMWYIIQYTTLTKIKNKNTWSHNSKDAGKQEKHDKIYPVMITRKPLNKMWTEEMYLNKTMAIYDKVTANIISSVQLLSHVQLCDPMDCSTPDFPVHHQLLELTQTHVHSVGDAIQPSHPLSSPSPPTFNLS